MVLGLLNDENAIVEELAGHARREHADGGVFDGIDGIQLFPIGLTEFTFKEIHPVDFGYDAIRSW